MAKLVIFVILCAAIAAYGLDPEVRVDPQPIPKTTSTPTPEPPTPEPSTTEPPTPEPPTPEPPKPTPTSKPTTPSPSPKPTSPPTTKPTPPTTKPTTPTPTTKPVPPTNGTTTVVPPTTSPTPTTTTSSPITTTSKPVPPPEPVPGTWTVDYPSTNVSCIILKAAIVVEIPYLTKDNKTAEGVLVLKNATSDGSCQNKTQDITLMWKPLDNNISDSMIFKFKKNGTRFDLDYVSINFTVDAVNFPNANDSGKNITLYHKNQEFDTPVGKSYKCSKTQTLNLTDNKSNVTLGSVKISDLQFQAFYNVSGKPTFADEMNCEPYETPDIVPIAVGCALATLIIVVLVAYLIGRRRNQARGYLSMFTENKAEADYIPMKNLSCFQ